jgi:hypothetical protein
MPQHEHKSSLLSVPLSLRSLHRWPRLEEMPFSVIGTSLHSTSSSLISCRIVPVESGSGVSRNQAYNMVSVYGDAVLVEPSSNVDPPQGMEVIEKLEISIPLPK